MNPAGLPDSSEHGRIAGLPDLKSGSGRTLGIGIGIGFGKKWGIGIGIGFLDTDSPSLLTGYFPVVY